MIKKAIIILGTILLIFGLYNVKATINDVVRAEPLEQLIAIKARIQTEDELIEEWRPIAYNRYTLGDKVLYTISGNTSSEPVQNELDNIVVFRIIRNGYNRIGGDKLGLFSEEDAYIATQLAIDYIEKHFDLSEINNTYKVVDKLTSSQKTRANKIIEKAKVLVDIGFNSGENYNGKAELLEVGEMQKEEEYVSQIYKSEITNGKLLGYNVESNSDYSTANAKTGEVKVEFNSDEELFKVMIPNNKVKNLDELKINAKISYLTNKIYERANAIGRFAMLSEIEEIEDVKVVLLNTMKDIDLEEEKTDNSEEKEETEENNISKNENEEVKKDEINKEGEGQNEDTKVENKQDEIIDKEKIKTEMNTEEESGVQRKILPRTGADYFNFKLILINLILIIVFLAIKFIVSKNKLKTKTDHSI